jgi:hypothetical protein
MTRIIRNSRVRTPAIFVGLCALAVGVSYCGKKDEAKVEAKFASLYANGLNGCAKCHVPGNDVHTTSVKNLDMSSATAAYTSLNLNMELATDACDTAKYVVASSSAKSALWAVMDNTTREAFAASTGAAGCSIVSGEDMGIAPLSTEFKTALKSWIDAGAANN